MFMLLVQNLLLDCLKSVPATCGREPYTAIYNVLIFFLLRNYFSLLTPSRCQLLVERQDVAKQLRYASKLCICHSLHKLQSLIIMILHYRHVMCVVSLLPYPCAHIAGLSYQFYRHAMCAEVYAALRPLSALRTCGTSNCLYQSHFLQRVTFIYFY